MRFHKYHGLGNDYIVLDPETAQLDLAAPAIRLICDRHYGIGSDGILWGPIAAQSALSSLLAAADLPSDADVLCGLRIFNPDGSQAEKSGNGLRIFCRYLWDTGRVRAEAFRLATLGGVVGCHVLDQGRAVRVAMGKASFDSDRIPVTGPAREVVQENLEVAGQTVRYTAATVGNPHCVVVREVVSEAEARALGPGLETHESFPNRTNVQFMQVLDRNNIRIEIWERGAGYTLASGSSASACAAIARKLGLCDQNIIVHMPGGNLRITVDENFSITMEGPVSAVADGQIAPDLIGRLRGTDQRWT